VLDAMENAGVPRDDLVVAWDFTTASDESVRSDLESAVGQSLDDMAANSGELGYTIDTDEPNDSDGAFRKVVGTFRVPLFLSNGGEFEPTTTILRDGDHLPQMDGYHDVPFTAIIPSCATQGTSKVPVIIHGHGLFGEDNQAATGALKKLSTQMCAIVIGTIMRGMSIRDIPNVLLALNDYNLADLIFGTMVQGIVNHVALAETIAGPMAESLFLNGEGQSIVDTDNISYYGLSQGHIFGATIAKYTPRIHRSVLGVGGANYSMMLERSQDWPTYRTVVIGAYDDPLNVAIILNLMQMRWDSTEPSGVITELPTPEGTPAADEKQFLLHMAVGDSQVPNIATEYQARTMGLPVLSPAVYEPQGIPAEEGPLRNALVIYDNGDGPIPLGDEPPPDNEAHYLTRNVQAGRDQIQHFLETGEIINTCGDGPCDCTSGACD
jgi:hypothetical protein